MGFFEIFFMVVGVFGFGFWILAFFTSLGRGPAKFTLTEPVSFASEYFFRVLEGLSRTTFEYGGLPEILNNGNEFFSAFFKDIFEAKYTIHIATFILRPSDPIGQALTYTLMKKAREGVKVRLLLDSSGSKNITKKVYQKFKNAGIKVVMFRPFEFGILTQYNRRSHCRAFVIDGRVGYTGGMAFGQEWTGDAEDKRHWRDQMFRVTGAQARAIQRVFSSLWTNTCGQVLVGEGIYPALDQAPLKESRWISLISSPALQTNPLRNAYWLSLMAAKKTIYVQQSYFFPSRYMRQALMQKAHEGVEVILILPNEHNDEKIVYYAGRFFYDQLLSAGVKIYEFLPTMIHSKNFLADDIWSIIGSANMDIRSEELNDENILCILSPEFGQAQRQHFEADLAQSKQILLPYWRKRPWQERCLESLCMLLGRQL